jgi:transposase-like protein
MSNSNNIKDELINTKRRYSNDTKDKVITLLVMGYSMSHISRSMNIPISSINNWKKNIKDLDSKIAKYRDEKREEIIAKEIKIIELATERLINDLEDKDKKISTRDLAIIKCQSIDKVQLLTGNPTENINAQMQLSDADKKLLDNLAKRQSEH